MLSLNKPEAPDATTKAFARVSVRHILTSLGLIPCAERLYYWLLQRRKAGKDQELDLADFQEFTAQGRHRPYSLKQIWRAIRQLKDYGLLEILKRWRGDSLKLIAYHVSQIGTKMSETGTKMSEKQPSNPHGCVLSYRDIREEQITPTHHPVVVGMDKEELIQTQEILDEQVMSDAHDSFISRSEIAHEKKLSGNGDISFTNEITKLDQILPAAAAALEECESLGVDLHPQIRKQLLAASLEDVKNAIAALREAKEKKEISNPTGYIRKAVTERWQPRNSERLVPKHQQSEFISAYERLRQSGLVADIPPAHLPEVSGELCVRWINTQVLGGCELLPWRKAIARINT